MGKRATRKRAAATRKRGSRSRVPAPEKPEVERLPELVRLQALVHKRVINALLSKGTDDPAVRELEKRRQEADPLKEIDMRFSGELPKVTRETERRWLDLHAGATSHNEMDPTLLVPPDLQKNIEALGLEGDELLAFLDKGYRKSDQEVHPPTNPPQRLKATVDSPDAVRRMDAYLSAQGIGLTEFAVRVNTTDRTLRSFRKTSRVRRDIFEGIAKAIGISKEDLLKRE